MALIVLSHQLGAGGPEIGLALSQRLGYRYVDQELLQDAGLRYGLALDKLSHLDDSKPSFFERFDTETRHHITVLQTTLLELAELDSSTASAATWRTGSRSCITAWSWTGPAAHGSSPTSSGCC